MATNVKWQPASNGISPANAVPGSRTNGNETLYLGRARHNGAIIPGKVHPSHGRLYVPYGGLELKFTDYEQLVYV